MGMLYSFLFDMDEKQIHSREDLVHDIYLLMGHIALVGMTANHKFINKN